MNLFGVHLTLWIGPTLPVPVSPFLAEALRSVEVTHSDQGPSGFQLTFQIGRATALDLMDYRLLTDPLLQPFNRVVVIVRFAIAPQVLMDGVITNQQLNPSNEPGASTLTVTGEDLSVLMDLEEEHSSHLAMPDYGIVFQLVTKYGRYGLVPPPPPTLNPQALVPRNPLEEMTQRPADLTDRAYIQQLADDYGFLFYVTPGPLPLASRVHWGPPELLSIPQAALSINMGPETNVDSLNFTFDGLRPQQVTSVVGESQTQNTYSTPSSTRSIFRLARNNFEARRKVSLTDDDPERAKIRAQSMVDQSFDEVVTANGQLDALRYNGLLNPRGLVGLRGVGQTYDGFYYVKSVTHNISKGRYTQGFSLSREGTGTTTPFVLP
jgi:hypothetical protein